MLSRTHTSGIECIVTAMADIGTVEIVVHVIDLGMEVSGWSRSLQGRYGWDWRSRAATGTANAVEHLDQAGRLAIRGWAIRHFKQFSEDFRSSPEKLKFKAFQGYDVSERGIKYAEQNAPPKKCRKIKGGISHEADPIFGRDDEDVVDGKEEKEATISLPHLMFRFLVHPQM